MSEDREYHFIIDKKEIDVEFIEIMVKSEPSKEKYKWKTIITVEVKTKL